MTFIDQLDETVEKIIDEAIDFYMWSLGWIRGENDNTYANSLMMGWEITAPGKPDRSTGGQCTFQGQPKEFAFEYGTGTNAGAFVYKHFEDAIRQLFMPWSTVPDPARFDPFLDYLREAAWSIQLDSDGTGVDDVPNAAVSAPLETLKTKMGGDDMGGDMILAFYQNFCVPMSTAMLGQYAVTVLAGVTLCGEKEIWAKARTDVLGIADKMHTSMRSRGSDDAFDLDTITALVNLAALFPTPAKPILSGAGSALGELGTLLGIKDAPSKPPVDFPGDRPDDVIEKAKEALKKLGETIGGREKVLDEQIKAAMTTVTSRSGSFDLPKPEVLGETQINGMKVDLGDLSFLATKTLPLIEKQLNLASDNINHSLYCGADWYRSPDLGTGDENGAYFTWRALCDMGEALTADLAWEVKESAAHLAIAADQTGRTEAEVEASMKRHADGLGNGSGYDPVGDANDWLKEHR